MIPQWLAWARRLQAIAQSGLTYATGPYDIRRYEEVRLIAAEILAGAGGGPLHRIRDWFERESGYATPKVDVRAAVFEDGRVLLVRERENGRWTLPGGWADVGDSPSEAVERETREESGYPVQAVKLAMLYDRDRHAHPPIPFHSYKLFFLCRLTGGEPRASGETDGGFLRRGRPAAALADEGDSRGDSPAVRASSQPSLAHRIRLKRLPEVQACCDLTQGKDLSRPSEVRGCAKRDSLRPKQRR